MLGMHVRAADRTAWWWTARAVQKAGAGPSCCVASTYTICGRARATWYSCPSSAIGCAPWRSGLLTDSPRAAGPARVYPGWMLWIVLAIVVLGIVGFAAAYTHNRTSTHELGKGTGNSGRKRYKNRSSTRRE